MKLKRNSQRKQNIVHSTAKKSNEGSDNIFRLGTCTTDNYLTTTKPYKVIVEKTQILYLFDVDF